MLCGFAEGAAASLRVQELADDLKAGKTMLIHCGAGAGRTGTMGAAVLMKLGFSGKAALKMVRAAGSGPETAAQRALLDSYGP